MNILWLYNDPVATFILVGIPIIVIFVVIFLYKESKKPVSKTNPAEQLLHELNTRANGGKTIIEAKEVFREFQKVYKNTGGTVVIPSGNNPYEKDADLVLQVNINKSPYIFHRSRLTQIWEIKPPEIPSF